MTKHQNNNGAPADNPAPSVGKQTHFGGYSKTNEFDTRDERTHRVFIALRNALKDGTKTVTVSTDDLSFVLSFAYRANGGFRRILKERMTKAQIYAQCNSALLRNPFRVVKIAEPRIIEKLDESPAPSSQEKSSRGEILWRDVVAAEPRLVAVMADAQKAPYHASEGKYWRDWFKLKARINELVGWFRPQIFPEWMRGHEAYDCAYHTIYDAYENAAIAAAKNADGEVS